LHRFLRISLLSYGHLRTASPTLKKKWKNISLTVCNSRGYWIHSITAQRSTGRARHRNGSISLRSFPVIPSCRDSNSIFTKSC